MSNSRPIVSADNNNEGRVMINWSQVSEDAIKYNTNDEEETMRAKAKESKRRKAAEQARQEEQARLEAKRAAQERAEREAKEKKAREEEEKWEAEHKCKAGAGKGDEAGTSGEAGSEVKRVVMDPGCTRCARAQVICKFVIDSNKKHVACVRCNQSKGKCQWPGDGKDAEAGPKIKADKGKKWKANEEMPEPGPSKKKTKAVDKSLEVLDIDEGETGGSRPREPGVAAFSGLEDKLERLIDIAGLITNNLAGLFEAHEAVAKNSGRIANALEAMLDKSYSFRMAVSPSDLGSSELDSDELCEEGGWLKAHGEDGEEETKGVDEAMAEAK
ncbi:hypothetical protein M404DRAFT_21729 [Pisolithus tinctorius Marx 270]|uniref:Zn(2)-C6 fungal-type domain-containing protein n=1 Tax=Pisolithus tinctorius Marx 270 TaxID=870435 RepID=A0A0C3P986_PISTI|nr:hypothetical protein M404DRAFT_21729 [Pisolithus tinctorius Marx 270]